MTDDSNVSIHVSGDAYKALFYLPHGRLFLKGVAGAHAHVMPVGTEYIYQAIRAICNPESLRSSVNNSAKVDLKLVLNQAPFSSPTKYLAWYETNVVGTMHPRDTPDEKLPLLRLTRSETEKVACASPFPGNGAGIAQSRPAAPNALPGRDVLVNWLGELAGNERAQNEHVVGPKTKCEVHVQVGLKEPLKPQNNSQQQFRPAWIAEPAVGRILVVNIGEISATHRVRRSLSYEAVAVDLLRFLRGDGAQPKPNTNALEQLSFSEPGKPPWSVLAVRINNSAVFLYVRGTKPKLDPNEKQDRDFEEAWLLCHRKESAPLTQPELGQMVGYTGFVSSHLAPAMAHWIVQTDQSNTKDFESARKAILDGVKRSLIWQRASYERGCLHMLFEPKPKAEDEWQSIQCAPGSSTEYRGMLQDVVDTLRKKCKVTIVEPSLQAQLTQFDNLMEKEVFEVKVEIDRAVAHRTQWFMARSLAERRTSGTVLGAGMGSTTICDDDVEKYFFETAMGWVSRSDDISEIQQPSKSPIPIVTIGEKELTDRREVEDFLAIHQALSVYGQSTTETKPLNLAVFGGPGSGKSFAVNQVVRHIDETNKGVFKKDPLTFNLSQFKTLDDLPAALHLVRNECLSGKIPIVFFDEFDSTFNGQPFGWLKFFLAPMQDGEFYHDGRNYKIGRAVFVFAGGVNRSFEELNGRLRNPSFCEAKGPDFISRLKAHLNVQGINKREDEADQSRYILRRGILLRSLVRRRLGLKSEQEGEELLHQSVARALLKVERFKHGVRSLEAIIKMCSVRPGYPIGPSDLPSMDQLEMHVDAAKLLKLVDEEDENAKRAEI